MDKNKVTRRGLFKLLGCGAAVAVMPKLLLALADPEIAGTYGSIDRSAYPGRFSTPTISAHGTYLTPAVVRRYYKLQLDAMNG